MLVYGLFTPHEVETSFLLFVPVIFAKSQMHVSLCKEPNASTNFSV